jgi:GAF domain-containing protein
MSRTPKRTSTDPQRIIADLRRELDEAQQRLVERTTERDEALKRETATAEVLGVINSSPGDLAPVFDAILEKAIKLLGAVHGTLRTYDGEAFHLAAVLGEPAFVQAARQFPTTQGSRTIFRLLQGEEVVHIADLRDDADNWHGDAARRAIIDLGGARTLVLVPLRKNGRLVGTIHVYRQEVRPFTDKQIALLQNFAAQAVIAMENARLLGELRQRTGDLEEALEQQTATAEVLSVINSSPGELTPVFDAMLEKAVRLCGATYGNLLRYDGQLFSQAAAVHPDGQLAERVLSMKPFPPTAGGPLEQILNGEEINTVSNIEESAAYRFRAEFREMVDRSGFRSCLNVALRKEGTLLGVITVFREEAGTFSDKQIALLQNFAAQAVIAMENARLITETREALEQQTATAEVLGVINSSPGDLTPVFDTMLERAMRLCEAHFGVLNTYDGERFHRAAARGEPPAHAEWRLNRQAISGPGTGHARVVAGEDVVHTPDLMAEAPYRDGDPDRRAFVDLAGARTGLIVALRKDGTLLGTIRLYRQEVRPFTEKQIALLQNFAEQAVIAMENARLITETREALEQQTATAEVLGVINASPGDLGPVFDAILEKAHSLCGIAFGSLQLYEAGKVRAVAVRAIAEDLAELLRQPMAPRPGSSMSRLIAGERFVQTADIAELAERFPDDPRIQLSAARGLRTGLFVPLRKEADLLGYISAFRDEVRAFSEGEIALLENFAAQAVIAMENARLLTETREALEQQTATAEVLGVINSSPGDLTPVFDAMLERATRLCAPAFAVMFTWDGERFHRVAWRGGTPEAIEASREAVIPPPGSPGYRLVNGEDFVAIADLAADEIARTTPVQYLLRFGARSYVTVGLRKDGRLLGGMGIYRQEVRPFSDKEIALLQNFAAQAVIAMENARLITETREALEQQTATAEVLGVINSSPGDLAPVFDALLDKALRLCGASYGSLNTWDGERFHPSAFGGGSVELIEALGGSEPFTQPPGSVADRLLRGENIIYTADITQDPGFDRSPRVQTVARVSDARSYIAVSLRKDDRFLGFITIYRQEVRPFNDKQIALLENFAAQAVIAMENARLIGELREALEQQTATAEVLGVINASPGDLAPVFEAILEKAHSLCGIAQGALVLYDGEYFRAVAIRGYPEKLAEVIRKPYRGNDRHQRLLDGERYDQVTDVTARVATRSGPLSIAFRDTGIETVLMIPMRKNNKLLGQIVAARQEVRLFTEKEIALLENFAAQAVIAMENARLLGELRQRTDEVAELNRGLEARVAEQVDELGRVGRLKRFLAPQLAELIVSQGDEKILESHRREIVVVFCDLRGYTAFTETAEPEEVLDFLREYHGALGPLVAEFEGTLDQFSGDGIMVFFNDPVPIPDPAERAVKMAVAMREAAGNLIAAWRERGRDLGFGAGIAQGYATLGQIGFAERSGYTAIGTVCNVAARLCAEAKDGQILLSQRVAVAVKATATLEEIGALTLKGLMQPVVAFNVPLAGGQAALRVIEGGAPNA